MTNYLLSKEAQEDLENIYRFGYFKFGERQADLYFEGLIKCFDTIVSNPLQFPKVDHIRKGYRKCVYMTETIYFRIDKEIIIISSIIGRQDEKRRL